MIDLQQLCHQQINLATNTFKLAILEMSNSEERPKGIEQDKNGSKLHSGVKVENQSHNSTIREFSFGNLHEANPKNQVIDAKDKLDNLIEDLNDKLVNHFKMKEEALLNQYKQELIEQQKKLEELKSNTNEQQIKAKMLERKAELEKQRNQLIQTNMFFSRKCEEYKQTYSKLVQESKELETEITFLDQQIDSANAKRVTLIQEAENGAADSSIQIRKLESNMQLPVLSGRKKDQASTTLKKDPPTVQKSYHTNSVRKIARSLHVPHPKVKENSQNQAAKQMKSGNYQIFEKGTLEKLFEESVEEVKARRKTKRTMPNLSGEEFTEYEKRAIMETFLSNEQAKKRIYEIIFDDRPNAKGNNQNSKVKIQFEDNETQKLKSQYI